MGFSTLKLVPPDGGEDINVSFIGVEPGMPGEPTVYDGQQLMRSSSNNVIVDEGVVACLGVKVGDVIRAEGHPGHARGILRPDRSRLD